jgi:hypothetical protein
MPVVRVALTALGVAVAVARHPVVRAGVRAVVENPQAREAAIRAARRTAYGAGVFARKVVPRSLVQ